VELYLHSLTPLSWRGSRLKHQRRHYRLIPSCLGFDNWLIPYCLIGYVGERGSPNQGWNVVPTEMQYDIPNQDKLIISSNVLYTNVKH